MAKNPQLEEKTETIFTKRGDCAVDVKCTSSVLTVPPEDLPPGPMHGMEHYLDRVGFTGERQKHDATFVIRIHTPKREQVMELSLDELRQVWSAVDRVMPDGPHGGMGYLPPAIVRR